jgi:hypothetical protein
MKIVGFLFGRLKKRFIFAKVTVWRHSNVKKSIRPYKDKESQTSFELWGFQFNSCR